MTTPQSSEKVEQVEALIRRIESATDHGSAFEAMIFNEINDAIHELLPEPKVVQPPNYCRSIDAAATIRPAGYRWKAGELTDGGWGLVFDGEGSDRVRLETFAATPSLALCAAGLRASIANHGTLPQAQAAGDVERVRANLEELAQCFEQTASITHQGGPDSDVARVLREAIAALPPVIAESAGGGERTANQMAEAMAYSEGDRATLATPSPIAEAVEALDRITLRRVINEAKLSLRLVQGCRECNAGDERRWRETIEWLENLA